jgi:hypothetical protein
MITKCPVFEGVMFQRGHSFTAAFAKYTNDVKKLRLCPSAPEPYPETDTVHKTTKGWNGFYKKAWDLMSTVGWYGDED